MTCLTMCCQSILSQNCKGNLTIIKVLCDANLQTDLIASCPHGRKRPPQWTPNQQFQWRHYRLVLPGAATDCVTYFFLKNDDLFSVIIPYHSSVTKGGGRTVPGDTIQGGYTRMKQKMWLNLERTLLDKRRRKVGVVRRRQLKGHHSAEGDD